MRIEEIALSMITLPPELDREALDPDELNQLAASIDTLGLINPITVETQGDHYMLRAGRRRLEAYRLLHRSTISCNVRAPGEIGHGELITWAENLERAQLSFLEEAKSIGRMIAATGLSPAKIAKHLHRSQRWVEDRLDLLKAPPDIQRLVHSRDLALVNALELARVDDESHRDHLVHWAVTSGATGTVIRDWVAQWRLHKDAGTQDLAPLPPMLEPGQRYVMMIPCLTCGQSHPAEQLRIVRICPTCVESIIEATAQWRSSAAPKPAQQGDDVDNSPTAGAGAEQQT